MNVKWSHRENKYEYAVHLSFVNSKSWGNEKKWRLWHVMYSLWSVWNIISFPLQTSPLLGGDHSRKFWSGWNHKDPQSIRCWWVGRHIDRWLWELVCFWMLQRGTAGEGSAEVSWGWKEKKRRWKKIIQCGRQRRWLYDGEREKEIWAGFGRLLSVCLFQHIR